jgi:hypothetical protein
MSRIQLSTRSAPRQGRGSTRPLGPISCPPVSTFDRGSADPNAWVCDRDSDLHTHRPGACVTCDAFLRHFYGDFFRREPSLVDARARLAEARKERSDEGANETEEIVVLRRKLEEVRRERDRLTEANHNLQRQLTSQSDSPPDSPRPHKRPHTIRPHTPTPPHHLTEANRDRQQQLAPKTVSPPDSPRPRERPDATHPHTEHLEAVPPTQTLETRLADFDRQVRGRSNWALDEDYDSDFDIDMSRPAPRRR